jgi:hypothetical protein
METKKKDFDSKKFQSFGDHTHPCEMVHADMHEMEANLKW